MNRIFTFLLALFISVTLSAQRSTADYPKTPESPAAKFQKEFLKQLDQPGQLSEAESPETIEPDFHVRSGRSHVQSGRPYSGLKDAPAARSEPVAYKKRLDSIIGEKTKYFFEYDENDNPTSTIEYIKDSITGLWRPNLKGESSYDENGRTTMDAEYHWDDSLKQWVGDWRTDYTRNENGRITLYLDFAWETNEGKWIYSEKWEYGYNENGARATFTLYEWDAELDDWVGIYTEQYNYDANDDVSSSSSSWEWDPLGKQFKPGFKMEYTRNDSGQVTSWIESRFDPGLGDWVYTQRGDNTYDANGNATQNLWSTFDTISSQFIPTSKYDNTFDADGDQTSRTSAFYNADSSRWENSQKWEYIYDNTKSGSSTVSVNADKIHVTTIVYVWYPFPIPGAFVPLSRTDYTYDADGEITKTVNSNWDFISEVWEEAQQEVSEYNSQGYLILREVSVFNKDLNAWIVTSRRVHVYDANGYNLSNASYGLDYLLNILVGYSFNEYTRDEHGNVLSRTDYLWDLILSAWVGNSRYEYTYDYNFAGYDILAPFYMWHMITSYIEYVYFGGTLKSSEEWVQSEAFTYHYSDMNVGVSVADLSGGELSIYPNPATDYIQIEGDLDTDAARVVMYNVSGKMVVNQVLDNGGRILVGHLSEGIYVIRLVQGSKVKTGKVMIE
jgi:hypothetical protein